MFHRCTDERRRTPVVRDVLSDVLGQRALGLAVREQEHALAHTPADELLALPFLDPEGMGGAAYGYAKRGNHLRVQAESLLWGAS
jgi:hypothetical protein